MSDVLLSLEQLAPLWETVGDGSSVGLFLPLPEPLAKMFPSLLEDPSPSHVTLLIVGEVLPEDEDVFLSVLRDVSERWGKPFHAHLAGLDYFRHPSEDQTIAHVAVEFSQDVARLRERLRDALLDAGFPIDDYSPALYRPHVTLGYLKGLWATWEAPVPQGTWEVDSIVIWGLPEEQALFLSVPPLGKTGHKITVAYPEGDASYDVGSESLPYLFNQTFAEAVWESGEEETYVPSDMLRQAAEEPKTYTPAQIKKRNEDKAKHIEKLRKDIANVRAKYRSGLHAKGDETRNVALAVALMDETFERVGNPESAKKGHYGVTGWKVKHVTFQGNSSYQVRWQVRCLSCEGSHRRWRCFRFAYRCERGEARR